MLQPKENVTCNSFQESEKEARKNEWLNVSNVAW